MLKKLTNLISFFFKIDPLKSQTFKVLKENLKYVREEFSKIPLPNYNLAYWLPAEMQAFYIYQGAFFSFHCETNVIWIDFVQPIIISPDIVSCF